MTRSPPRVFVYGTLMVPEIVRAVLAESFVGKAARLPGYARYRMRGVVYPGVVAAAESEVIGLLYEPVSAQHWRLLDAYEGEQYQRRVVQVQVGEAVVQAGCYVVAPESFSLLTESPWDLEEFTRSHAARFRLDWD